MAIAGENKFVFAKGMTEMVWELAPAGIVTGRDAPGLFPWLPVSFGTYPASRAGSQGGSQFLLRKFRERARVVLGCPISWEPTCVLRSSRSG